MDKMEYDRKDLKIQALLEKVRDLTVVHENEKADLRVEVTLLREEIRQLNEKVGTLENSDVPNPEDQYVEEEVRDDKPSD